MEIHIKKAGYLANQSSIEQIDFSMQPGTITGLIGGNGAGKSTTIQSMLGVIPYFEGAITIPSYGYVPERPLLYEHFTLNITTKHFGIKQSSYSNSFKLTSGWMICRYTFQKECSKK